MKSISQVELPLKRFLDSFPLPVLAGVAQSAMMSFVDDPLSI